MKKRVFALLLCLVLCLSILPVGAFADDYCEHDIVKMEAKATCGEAHREHYKCTKCGKLFSDERGEHEISYESVAQAKPVHTSDLSHVDYKDASCTESGNYEYWVCTECGQMFSENPGFEGETDNRRTKPVPDDKVKDYTIEPYGHNLTFHEAVPHTCTQDGNVAYYQCTSCRLCFSDPDAQTLLPDITDYAPGHVKTEHEAVDHTCDTNGNTYYFYCEVCGKYYNEYEEEIAEGSWLDPARHDDVYHEARTPTCAEAGNAAYYSCENCGRVLDAEGNETTLEAVTLGKIPHSLTFVEAVPKTCSSNGNVEYWQCDVCGAKFADAEGTLPLADEDVVVPASHEFVATPAKEATCTEPGNIAYWTCTVEGCGIVVDESGTQVWETVVPAAGHKPVKVERTTTCTEAGTAEHYKCEVCGRLFQDETCTVEKTLEDLQEAALGHEYNTDGVCTRCGAISPDTPAFEGTSYVDVPTPQGTWQRVIVHATAPQGVFPAGAQLFAQVVVNVDAETEAAVDAAREEGTNRAASYTFDIKVLDRYGYEVQPADDSRVNVSFALAEVKNDNLNATVYHVKEEEDGSKSAEVLETTVEGEGENKTVVVETDGFSYYTVEFTYQTFQYVLPGGESVALSTILNDLHLTGDIVDARVSNPELFSASKNESGEWIVATHKPFQSQEKLIVTLANAAGQMDYEIRVTDDATTHKVKVNSGTAKYSTNPPAAEIDVPEESTVTITAATDPNRAFDKWTIVKGLQPSALTSITSATTTFKMPKTDVELTATYKWNVSFDMAGHGTAPATQQVADGGKATRPTTPTDANYVFGNWYTDKECTALFDFNSAITKDTIVYAKWRCQVTFLTNHGTAPSAQIVDIGATATKPTDLSWIGYKWGGWCSDPAWKNAFDFKTPIMSDTVLYAEWIPDLKITKGDGGTAHYGSTYAFTLNYYYPDYNKNSSSFAVYIGRHNSSTASEISKSHYVVTQGADKRAVVTLKASYIRTLTDGATYDIIFDTGLGPYDYDASKYPPIDLGATEGTFKVSKSPKTGDESNVALWAAIAGVSLIVVIVIAVVLLNKRKKGKKAPTPPETRSADKTRKPPKE